MRVSFQGYVPRTINEQYTRPESREKTVAVLGSSKTTDEILTYMDVCANSTRVLVQNGKNVVHGCGSQGIMGEVYHYGYKHSRKDADGKPVQNLAILAGWPDEDKKHCIPIAVAKNEADRIEKFAQVADTMLIFPGGAGTLQEAATFISNNYYGKPEDRKKIILVGSSFFKGLVEQYNQLYKAGMIKNRPEELFTVVDSEKEIQDIIL